MKSDEYEPNVNNKLWQMIKDADLPATVYKEKKFKNKRADIFIEFDEYNVAVECELAGPNKRKEAERDAVSRLVSSPHASVAFAVVYPNGCTEDSLNMDTNLDIAIVDKYHASPQSLQTRLDGNVRGRTKKHSNTGLEWQKRKVRDLISMILHTKRDLGDPDSLVYDLNAVLDMSVYSLKQSQLGAIGRSLDLPPSGSGEKDWRPPARRALLVVASAAMFHRRLDEHLHSMKPRTDVRTGKPFKGKWPPKSLPECYDSENAVKELLDSWNLILAVDYRPIFEAGRSVLNSLDSPQFTNIVKNVIEWARLAVGSIGGLRHDVLGRIFHKLLDDAKYDGSFYTSVPASIMLSSLAIRNRKDLPKNLKDMKVMDVACGTGTLLMATAERIRDVVGSEYDPKVIIEDVLTGIDINATALHMTATTLGLLSPTTQFRKMDIRQAPFGLTTDNVAAGSLEMYGKGGTFPIWGWADTTATTQIETMGQRASASYASTADLVIMNPPFTRSDLRHRQLGPEIGSKVKQREAELYKSAPIKVDKSSSGPMFLILAHHLVKKNGTIAFVFPLSFVTGPSAASVRKFLAETFYIECIVVSHDPKRFWFSENTSIAEMLVILRGERQDKPTQMIHLATNPDSATGAATLVNRILNGEEPNHAHSTLIPNKTIGGGEGWSGVQFFSPYLFESFSNIQKSDLFPTVKLGSTASLMPRGARAVRDYFEKSRVSGGEGWLSIYGNRTNDVICIQNQPDTYIKAKKGKKTHAKEAWSHRSTLLLPEKLRTNLARVTAIHATLPTISPSWISVNLLAPDIETEPGQYEARWSKAMAMYLNSTVGIVSMLGVKIPKILDYPRWSIGGLQNIPVPQFSKNSVNVLAYAYDGHATKPLGRMAEFDDVTRTGIDNAVSRALGINAEKTDRMRLELSKEPMCTGKRYGQ